MDETTFGNVGRVGHRVMGGMFIVVVGALALCGCVRAIGPVEIRDTGPRDKNDSGATEAGIDTGATEASIDTGATEAGIDGVLPDAPPDATRACSVGLVLCNGACIAGNNCTGCGADKLFCAATRSCVASCSACVPSLPIECWACKSNDPPNPSTTIGTCEPNTAAQYCLNGDYSNAYNGGPGAHCDCDADVANCIGAHQVCVPIGGTDWCVTCGEIGVNTQGRACKGGGTCNTSLYPPRCT